METNAQRRIEFISKATKVHGEYDYSLSDYKNSRTKIIILCKLHGQFKQTPKAHVSGRGCPECSKNKIESFIRKAVRVHGDKYIYDNVKYINYTTAVVIICKKHGEFLQSPRSHLTSAGCKLCIIETKLNKKQHKICDIHGMFRDRCIKCLRAERFIQNAIAQHGDKYDYSNVRYVNSTTKIEIICKEHGSFWQLPSNHIYGYGCLQCSRIKTSASQFSSKAKLIHGDKYDYSHVKYNNCLEKVSIICPVHGLFLQTPNRHLSGNACPHCYIADAYHTTESFIESAKLVHGDRYDYGSTIYNGYRNKIDIICKKHGLFTQFPHTHLCGSGCKRCSNQITKPHQNILEMCSSLHPIINDRKQLDPYEIDVYFGDYNVGVEINGAYYHSFDRLETRKERLKHQFKHLLAKNNNIRLLQFTDIEIINKSDLILSMINSACGISEKLHARKCRIVHLNDSAVENFFKTNHIQGHRHASITNGLIFNDEIVSAMSFSSINNGWEIIRFATKIGTTVVGGASKLLQDFIINHNPRTLTTFADARFSSGNVYQKIGFELLYLTDPNYCYYKNNLLISRHRCQKNKLRNLLENYNPLLSESENMFINGFRRLWDAGHYKFKYVG